MPAITYDEYPVQADVEELLVAVGITVPTQFDAEALIGAAIDAWEEGTNYLPFLAPTLGEDDDEPVFYYDPPGPNLRGESRGGGRILLLDRGFVSISEIRTGISASDATGTLLVSGTDYRLEPYNSAYNKKPYTRVSLTYPAWGTPRSIKITGIPGYCAVLKAEVWNAIREDAAARYLEAMREGRGGKSVEWHDGDGTSERKSIELIQKWGQIWRSRSLDVRRRYTRLS